LTAVPACPATPEAGSCPPTEARASFASCSETGLLCAYASACPSSFDQCECFPGKTADGGFGLRFECSPALCTLGDSGAPIDGGSDSMFDAGESGAGSDSAAEADARPSGDAAAEADSARGADSASDAGAETTADALSEVASASDADSTETASGSDVDSASEAGSDGDSASSEGAAGDAGRG